MVIEDFYKSRAWAKKRAAVLKRDGYRCQRCKRYGRITQATTVHHVLHLEDRPDLALTGTNLISLCASCHAAEHPEKGGNKSMFRR